MAGLELPPSVMRQASRTNPRIPPIARRSVSPFPCRMAVLSRDKLQKEASTKSPDLRRCLAHHHLLNRSIEAAQQDVRSRMASYQLDDEEDAITPSQEPAEATAVPIIRVQITNAVRAMVKRRAADQKQLGGGLARGSASTEKSAKPSSTSSSSSSSSSTKKSLRNMPRVVFGRRRWALYGPLQAGVVS